MKTINTKDSVIEIGSVTEGSLTSVLQVYKNYNLIIIVDENTHDNCLEYMITSFPELERAEIILLPVGEENKVMEVCFQVWQAFTEYGFGRKDLVINLGGGVVTDMGGFIASIYKRGLKFINVPTSLLGMVDAAIGGKTGIDLDRFKNQLGTFSHPTHIFIDPIFLQTLPEEEVFNGYAEMVKHALIKDVDLWEKIRVIHSEEELTTIENIYTSVKIKTDIVDGDPTEKGERKILNFGHTIGHALESYFLDKTAISHGHAVALGMCAESFISFKRNWISKEVFKDIEATITASFPMISLNADEVSVVISLMYQDKKNESGKIFGSILKDVGLCSYDVELSEDEIGESLFHLSLLANSLN
ncbi:MAG: 3-dehydroquinate synthase [Flavobacteriales bacterium]|nr:3-dehydroquinate synthase [Crocinitomicaceae bacterium]NBX80107.1 3-dehydroquinate synthase [Flavobacteriales bacterium]NCA21044.1 3-dehydroquinate synthase [Crocinitomicaceae bacterium]